MASAEESLAQVAFVSDRVDVHEASRWYERVLGFLWTPRDVNQPPGVPPIAVARIAELEARA